MILAAGAPYHRDIKPANLFWWDDGPVLADFDLSAISVDMGDKLASGIGVVAATEWMICAG